jgi:TetR/AcrR family transcriptional regulator
VQQSRSRSIEHAEVIVAAARRLLAEKDETFTTQQLVKEAGVALKTFYRHFASKDQLMLAVLENTILDACATFEQRARRMRSPVARLRFYVTAAIRSLEDDDVTVRRVITAEHYRLHQIFPDQLAAATRPFAELLQKEIELAQTEGLLAPRDARRDAWMVAELTQSLFHHYAFASTDESVDEIAAGIWQFCFAALGGQPPARAAGRRRPTTRATPAAPD